MKYRKIVEIEAVQWIGPNLVEISKFMDNKLDNLVCPPFTGTLIIKTLEGDMRAEKGDWIIKGTIGEFYPCKPDIFEKTYEPVEEPIIRNGFYEKL